jgi:MazG family protein
VEETYEVLEAIDELDHGYEHLEEELSDLLFQVVFHATLAAEAGQFTLADVARGIHDKLVRRHPHVFGGETVFGREADWEQIKKAEKGHSSLMEGVPGYLPALLYAHKVQSKAASVGFDWDDAAGPMAKVREELAELEDDPSHEELGDVLFSVVNVARHLGVDPESALRDGAAKFRRRFAGVEALAAERGLDLAQLGLPALDRLWDEVKAGERGRVSRREPVRRRR